MPMISRSLTIVNKLGLHARAAARLVSLTSQFKSAIEIERNGRKVNGKSIMGVMMLAAAQGAEIIVHINGADARQAMTAIEALVHERFGETE